MPWTSHARFHFSLVFGEATRDWFGVFRLIRERRLNESNRDARNSFFLCICRKNDSRHLLYFASAWAASMTCSVLTDDSSSSPNAEKMILLNSHL
jgi:hypothetical protein